MDGVLTEGPARENVHRCTSEVVWLPVSSSCFCVALFQVRFHEMIQVRHFWDDRREAPPEPSHDYDGI